MMTHTLDFVRTALKHWLGQIIIILIIGISFWLFIHQSRSVPPNLYPYLTSLKPELVLSCIRDGDSFSPDRWVDLLAIQSTLSAAEAKDLLLQIRNNTEYSNLNWGNLSQSVRNTIAQRRNYLISYPFYLPGAYVFPVQGKTWYQDSFGADREGGKRRHEGTDLFSPEGTPILSASSGRIEKLGWNRLGGERVGVRGDDGNYYYYAHLKEINSTLVIGQRINKGDFLGTMGHTGDALTTPDHLHFGIQLPNEEWINPYPFLAVWQHFS